MVRERVIVVGAGLSGLAAGFDLSRGGADVTVLEANARAGGVVGTIEREGFLFETGPHTVQASAESFRRLCGDLGIADRLIATSRDANERYLLLRGRLQVIPRSPISFLASPLLSLGARVRVATEIFRRWRPPAPGAPEPTLDAFARERLGPQAARVLVGSFVRGVYASESVDLGARSALPRMWQACEEHGGLIRGLLAAERESMAQLPGPSAPRTALLSFPRGLQELVDALVTALRGRLQLSSEVESIERARAGWTVRIRDGDTRAAEHLILAIPAPVAARLLAPVAPKSFPLDSLRRVRHASVTLVHLGLDRTEVSSLPRGFGYLVPPDADVPRVLGTLFASNLFPGRAPEGCVAVSSFYSGAEAGIPDDGELAAIACADLSRALGERSPPSPITFDLRRWKDAIPRYSVGHAETMEEVTKAASRDLAGLHLAGNYVAGLSVEHVIARGRAVAAEILG